MSRQRPLRGACSCGRNHYAIVVPTDSTEQAQVLFDDSSESRRSQATPLTAWLRIPLDWFSSTTVAQFPDESHTSIRRIFTPEQQPNCKRVFCGYCGTHLSYWTEEPVSEASYLSVTVGSLLGDDIRALQDLDLLPDDVEPEYVQATEGSSDNKAVATTQQHGEADQAVTRRSQRQGRLGDLDWFEEMIDGSRLGRTQKTRRGMGASADGTTTVQWEVSEYREGDSEPSTPTTGSSKRKIGELNERGPMYITAQVEIPPSIASASSLVSLSHDDRRVVAAASASQAVRSLGRPSTQEGCCI